MVTVGGPGDTRAAPLVFGSGGEGGSLRPRPLSHVGAVYHLACCLIHH